MRFYDVVVIGRSLGTLVAATLLARRDFSVLLVGNGQRASGYAFEGTALRRRSFTLLFGASPVWKRILHDLAQSPSFKRRLTALDPMFAMRSKGCALEVPPDASAFAAEIDREFPEIRQLVDELYVRLGQVNASIDAILGRDLVWPPGTWFERFETGRAAARLPLSESENVEDLLGKFPAKHPYRELVNWPVMFASDWATTERPLPALTLARLHGSWTRGLDSLTRGEEELESFFLDRFRAHGGTCALEERVTKILVERKRIRGVLREGDEQAIGTTQVVSNLTGEGLAELAVGLGLRGSAERDWPRVTAGAGRFVVSLVVNKQGLSEHLPAETFLFPSVRDSPRHPVVHLQRASSNLDGAVLLLAEIILPRYGTLNLLEARAAILGMLHEHFPFLERHYLLVDSPHDGLPLYDYRSGERREWERIHLQGTQTQPEEMTWHWNSEQRGFLGLGGEPVRGPIQGSFLVGTTVLPGLGQEGELLAAWSAARIISRRNRVREERRRQLWTKIETS